MERDTDTSARTAARRRKGPLFRPVKRRAPSESAPPPLFAGRPRLVRRPKAPPFWRNIAPALLAANFDAPAGTVPLFQRQYYWRLVLLAKGIPHSMPDQGGRQGLYVPPVAEYAALREILAFEREKPEVPLPPPPLRDNMLPTLLMLCCLALWHALRWNGWGEALGLPAKPQDWLPLAGLDAYRVAHAGEWWRCVTALTMHADSAHLAGNLAASAVFGIPLFRRSGAGLGILLALLAGAYGNLLTAYLRPPAYMSQGFSTALFAIIGLLSAFSAVYALRHHRAGAALRREEERLAPSALRNALFQGLMPLGAGIALLAMLGGSEAPGVDYLAHSAGLLCGIVLGLATAAAVPALFLQKGRANALVQGAAGGLALGLLLLCWRYALG